MNKYGLGGLNNKFSANKSSNNFNANLQVALQQIIVPVRVKNIILNESNPKFKDYGEWNGLGVIEYTSANKPYDSSVEGYAYPINPNNKQYPLINEIVYLIDLPDTGLADFSSSTKKYYINIVSLWNHPHHNGFPANPYNLNNSQNKDYIQTQNGSARRVTDNSTEINLGNTFKERANVHPLLPFEGDIITEGRWGNSIRLGSTVKNTSNNWSTVGNNGDPILILRNGQLIDANNEGWVPIVEDINKDISSVYLTSTQKIPLNAASINYYSYKSNPPQKPDQYLDKQIILNSGRLLFNSNTDHILLSSAKSINLNAINNVNIDTNEIILQSNKVYLGSKNATEPVLLGDSTITLLQQLVNSLTTFMNIASTTVSTAPGTPLGPLNANASQTAALLQQLSKNLNSLKSKDVFVV
jgi:hypothetical protein